MKESRYRRYFWLSLIGVLAVSAYPLYMGIKVIVIMFQSGAVPIDDYPKYIIPYTPIAVAVIAGLLLMPLFQRWSKRFDLLCGSAASVIVFYIVERLMETKILVQTVSLIPLESWQMSLCYIPPEQYETRTWEAVDILLGGYSPAFKLHFYLIAGVIIISLLNSLYGWAKMILTGDSSRKKALTVQTTASILFLGMCIWACFTAFYRTGELVVSPVSALLMAVFFVLLGVTVGIFAASFTIGKGRGLSIFLPSVLAACITLAMYIGEMCLLSGNLYRFGSGFLFDGMGAVVLAPVDVLIILLSGAVTALIAVLLNRYNTK